MVMAAEAVGRAGLIAAADVHRVRSLLRRPACRSPGLRSAPSACSKLMAIDKKAAGGRVRFVLLDSVGAASLREAVR